MEHTRRWLLVLGWNLLCVMVTLEVAGNVLHWWEHGTIFLRRSPPAAATAAPIEPFSAGEFRPILHPYFGFLYGARTGTPERSAFHINNHSFVQDRGYVERHPDCCDFPVIRRASDEIVIGIFGGSVGGAVGLTAQHDDLLPRLLHAFPAYAGKRIRVLDFAVGAHKQPQQLQILAYYLSIGQTFDAVITIEGFNEVRVGVDNARAGVSVDFPATTWRRLAQFVDEPASRPQAATLLRAYHAVEAREWAEYADACSSATCYLVARAMSRWHGRGAAALPTGAGEWRPAFFTLYPANAEDVIKRVADNWARSVTMMHRLLAAQSTPFLVLLQPNQWFRATTPFRGGRSHDSRAADLAKTIPEGYRALRARIPELQAQGIAVIDASALFDQLGDDIYSDDVAHFTEEGNRMLVREVANWLEQPH